MCFKVNGQNIFLEGWKPLTCHWKKSCTLEKENLTCGHETALLCQQHLNFRLVFSFSTPWAAEKPSAWSEARKIPGWGIIHRCVPGSVKVALQQGWHREGKCSWQGSAGPCSLPRLIPGQGALGFSRHLLRHRGLQEALWADTELLPGWSSLSRAELQLLPHRCPGPCNRSTAISKRNEFILDSAFNFSVLQGETFWDLRLESRAQCKKTKTCSG